MAITTSQAIFSMGSADVEKLLNMSLDDLVRDRRKAKQMNQKALKSKSSKTTSEAKSKGTAKAKRMAAIANKRGMKPDSKPTPMDVDNQIKMVQSKLLDEHVKATKMVASKKKRTSKRRQALKLVNEASKNANVAKSQATKKGLKRANKPPKAPAKQVGKESSKKKLTKGSGNISFLHFLFHCASKPYHYCVYTLIIEYQGHLPVGKPLSSSCQELEGTFRVHSMPH
eukprot:329909_1